MPSKLIFNGKTGKQKIVKFTQAELDQREVDRVDAQVRQVEEDAKRKADQIVQLSLRVKEAEKLCAEGVIGQEQVDRYQAQLMELKNG